MSLQKKLKNLYTVYYLMTLRKSFDGDPVKIKADQNKQIHEIMKIAWNIPVDRKKFEESGW